VLLRHVTLWPWPLTSWPWTFRAHRLSCVSTLYKIWAKSNDPRLSYWRFNTFHCSILGGGSGAFLPNDSQGCVDPTSPNIGRSFLHKKFVSAFGYLAVFSNTGGSKVEVIERILKTTPNFALFDPHVKIWGEWARSLYQWLKLYLRPNLRNTFDGYPLRSCWAQCIDRKRKKRKESSWVKLKAFPTNARRPNSKSCSLIHPGTPSCQKDDCSVYVTRYTSHPDRASGSGGLRI